MQTEFCDYAFEPFFVMESLDELQGPIDKVGLPLGIDWTPHYGTAYDLSDPIECCKAYRLILSEGTYDDIVRFVDKGLLLRYWVPISDFMSTKIVDTWEGRFEVLRKAREGCGQGR